MLGCAMSDLRHDRSERMSISSRAHNSPCSRVPTHLVLFCDLPWGLRYSDAHVTAYHGCSLAAALIVLSLSLDER